MKYLFALYVLIICAQLTLLYIQWRHNDLCSHVFLGMKLCTERCEK